MIVPKEQLDLEDGEPWRGRFWIAGRPETMAAGVLRWSEERGAELWLIAPPAGWPEMGFSLSSAEVQLVIHGESAADGKKVTLPASLLTHSTFGSGSQLRLVDPRLVLFEHFEPGDNWKRLVVRTKSLHEWLPLTGLSSSEFSAGLQARRYELTWTPPRGKRVQLGDDELRLTANMAASASRWQPDRRIETAIDATFNSKSRDTLDSLHERFAVPLLDLLILATGRPDAITYEAALIGRRTRAVVLQRGSSSTLSEWRPWRPPLFYASQVPDLRKGVRKWFRLHARLTPALQVFTSSINEGRTYSPGRLLSVVGALETYHRVLYEPAWRRRWHRWNPGKKIPRPSLIERVAHLQQLSTVPEAMTGMTRENRELLVSTRNHFAHLSEPHYGYKAAEVNERLLDTTRRGVALMQACLMRQLGFSSNAIRERFGEHYRSWPIPL